MATRDAWFPATIAAGVTSLTVTNTNAIAVGDTILIAMKGGSATPYTCSDTANGSYTTTAGGYDSHNHQAFYFQNSAASANGANTVTVGSGGTAGSWRVVGSCFNGVAISGQPFDSSTSLQAGGSTTATAGASANTTDGVVVWAAFISATNSETFTAGSTNGVAETIGTQLGDPSVGSIADEYALSAVAGAQASTITLNANSAANDQFFQVVLAGASPVPFVPHRMPSGA